MFQPKPNSKCGAVAGGVNVSLHPSPRPGGLCHSHFCTNRNWYHVESPTAGTRTQSSTLTHTMKYTVSAATLPLLFPVFRPAWQKASCWIWLASWSCCRGTVQARRYERRRHLLITRRWWDIYSAFSHVYLVSCLYLQLQLKLLHPHCKLCLLVDFTIAQLFAMKRTIKIAQHNQCYVFLIQF